MDILRTLAEMRTRSAALRSSGGRIAFVPTMGALHEGHLSLIRIAAARAATVVVSVFVNPLQFGRGEDFEKYPRNLEADAGLARPAGTAVLFAPSAEELYPQGFETTVDVGPVGRVLEGASRPGHFNGVATVLAKLFAIVAPDLAVFGQKDAQQVVVVRRLVRDLDIPVEIVAAPIVREADGLALSSRNVYLSSSERAAAPVLRRALVLAADSAASGERDCGKIREAMRRLIATEPAAAIDYISIADPETLSELASLPPGRPSLVSLAVRFGRTRLIDNITV